MPGLKTIRVGVAIIFLKEEDYIVAYCPALELSSYAKTEAEAKKAFEEVLTIFLEETGRKHSLERVLLKLGWTLSHENYAPPRYNPEDLFRMYKTRNTVNVMTEQVPLPAVTMS